MSPENLESLDFINIGGGIPGKYKNTNDLAINLIFIKIKELKHSINAELILEPGRYIASHSIVLECLITAIQGKTIFVNCSIFNGALDTIISNIKLLVKGEIEKGEKWTIKGCSPASDDIFRYEVYLENPKKGDVICFLNAGAYNFHSDFCSLEKIHTIINQ